MIFSEDKKRLCKQALLGIPCYEIGDHIEGDTYEFVKCFMVIDVEDAKAFLEYRDDDIKQKLQVEWMNEREML